MGETAKISSATALDPLPVIAESAALAHEDAPGVAEPIEAHRIAFRQSRDRANPSEERSIEHRRPEPPQITDLPFIRDVLVHKEGKKRRVRRRLFWHVEPTGDYAADCETGQQWAIEYLKAQRRLTPNLVTIVAAMPAERTGLEVGFLSTIQTAAVAGLPAAERLVEYLKARYEEAE